MLLPCVDFGVQSNTKYDFSYNIMNELNEGETSFLMLYITECYFE